MNRSNHHVATSTRASSTDCSALACWVPCTCFHRPKRFSWLEGFSGQKEVVMKRDLYARATTCMCWGILVELVLCVLLGHPNSKIANSMKLVTFAFFSSQYHVFELKNIRGNLIAPNSNRWSLSNENAMSQEDNRKIISLFGQEKSIFLHPWMLKDLI